MEDVDFEKILYNEVFRLSSNELGVVALAFFKTRTKIKSCFLLNCIIRQLNREIGKVHEISLSAILKVSGYSGRLQE